MKHSTFFLSLFILLGVFVVLPVFAEVIVIDTGENFAPMQQKVDCPLEVEKSYKVPTSISVYYLSSDCKKRPIKNVQVFFSYFNSWNDVQETGLQNINAIENHPLGFVPFGPKYKPQSGSLIKTVDDPKGYFLSDGRRYGIASAEIFTQMGFSWNWIEDVTPELLQLYDYGGDIKSAATHVDGMVIQYTGDPKLFLIEGDKKRHITSIEAFQKLNYRLDRVLKAKQSQIYVDGSVYEK